MQGKRLSTDNRRMRSRYADSGFGAVITGRTPTKGIGNIVTGTTRIRVTIIGLSIEVKEREIANRACR
jgi:hypothetical protein